MGCGDDGMLASPRVAVDDVTLPRDPTGHGQGHSAVSFIRIGLLVQTSERTHGQPKEAARDRGGLDGG